MSVSTPLTLFLTQLLGPPPTAVQTWWTSAQCLQRQRGQPLIRAGEHWRHLWWVERGALRLYYLDRDGAESNKNFFLDGALCWPMTPTLRQQPVMFHVEPLEDSVVWTLPFPADADAPLPSAGWAPWAALEHRALCALLDGKMQREQEFLQLSARQRYARLLEQHPAWAERIALKHLASYLGVTDVSLSRLRSEMGLIKG
ncbi:Crp/Fnr family transcriptional regulator [Acidovorax sp. NB1]|uniref:Crp/Fnr family transcriptional regulator n=1 Tax=Acidovorax sp. NB1 TaxID=1943571 RepID=UPI002017EEC3|nr:Crp/Fnr family transcriptional regulator [Acidovorax sp. NB1]